MGIQIFDEIVGLTTSADIDNALGTAGVAIINNDQQGRRVDAVFAVTDSAVDVTVDLILTGVSGSGRLGSVVIPAGSGFGGGPPVELLHLLQGGFASGIFMTAGMSLVGALEVAVVSPHTVTFTGQGGYL